MHWPASQRPAVCVLMGKWLANSLLFSLNARERCVRICAEGMSLAQLKSPVHTVSRPYSLGRAPHPHMHAIVAPSPFESPVQFSSTPPSPADRDPETARKRPWQSYAPGTVALPDRPARSSPSHDAPP
ncbi:hypothetical protein GGX14DRAFT_581008 [Mycena pura]|uniref:Uncharacterized protein n=1 Tax=Mycena pura TaxID=153505 RepID=A0AAD6XX54_9AGAR|nr:hypothetical protein GGX14DRAFT_581008 [Mycena pura]